MRLKVIAPKAHETRRGLSWSGVLVVNDQPVARFEHAGDGGCLHIDWKPGLNHESIDAALVALAAGETFEPIDTAIGDLWDTAMRKGAA